MDKGDKVVFFIAAVMLFIGVVYTLKVPFSRIAYWGMFIFIDGILAVILLTWIAPHLKVRKQR
jgi:hypothetical protein